MPALPPALKGVGTGCRAWTLLSPDTDAALRSAQMPACHARHRLPDPGLYQDVWLTEAPLPTFSPSAA